MTYPTIILPRYLITTRREGVFELLNLLLNSKKLCELCQLLYFIILLYCIFHNASTSKHDLIQLRAFKKSLKAVFQIIKKKNILFFGFLRFRAIQALSLALAGAHQKFQFYGFCRFKKICHMFMRAHFYLPFRKNLVPFFQKETGEILFGGMQQYANKMVMSDPDISNRDCHMYEKEQRFF